MRVVTKYTFPVELTDLNEAAARQAADEWNIPHAYGDVAELLAPAGSLESIQGRSQTQDSGVKLRWRTCRNGNASDARQTWDLNGIYLGDGGIPLDDIGCVLHL